MRTEENAAGGLRAQSARVRLTAAPRWEAGRPSSLGSGRLTSWDGRAAGSEEGPADGQAKQAVLFPPGSPPPACPGALVWGTKLTCVFAWSKRLARNISVKDAKKRSL